MIGITGCLAWQGSPWGCRWRASWRSHQEEPTRRHAHTVGILLVAGRNEARVRYAPAGAPMPLAVANYTYDSLPPDERVALARADALAVVCPGFRGVGLLGI